MTEAIQIQIPAHHRLAELEEQAEQLSTKAIIKKLGAYLVTVAKDGNDDSSW